MSVFKDVFNGLKSIVKTIGRGISNVTEGVRKTLGLIAKPFEELGIVGTLALGIIMPWSMQSMFSSITSPKGWLAKTATNLVKDESLVKKALGFVMTGVHKGASMTQDGLGTAKSFITDKLSQGYKWLTGQIEEKKMTHENFPVETLENIKPYDLNAELKRLNNLEKPDITTDATLEIKNTDVRNSILGNANANKTGFDSTAENKAEAAAPWKTFFGNVFDKGELDLDEDLGGTVGYSYEPHDFIKNRHLSDRNVFSINDLDLRLKTSNGLYGGLDYMQEAYKVMEPIKNFWDPKVLPETLTS